MLAKGAGILKSAADFRIPPKDWLAAKAEARETMIRRAKVRGMIPYSDLVTEITALTFQAYDQRLFHLLGELSVEEDAAGRGMLSAVVVHKHGDMEPGQGFYLLGQHLGYSTKDTLRFWIEQLKKVHAVWSLPKR